ISLEACIDTAWTSSVLAVIFSTNAINSVELFFKTDSCLVISEAILMTLSTCPDSFTTGVYMASSQTISPFFERVPLYHEMLYSLVHVYNMSGILHYFYMY